MVHFSRWLQLESFMDSLDSEIAENSAFSRTVISILRLAEREFGRDVILENDEDEHENVELDDPFTGPDDAAPVFQEPESPAAEPQETAPRSDEDSRVKTLRKMLNALRSMRNHAMMKRAESVKKMAEIQKRIKAIEEEKAADEDEEYEKKELIADELKKAIPTLIDLGYVQESIREKLTKSHKDMMEARGSLRSALKEASEETGNDTMSMQKNPDELEKEFRKAEEEFVDATQKIYSGYIASVARGRRMSRDRIGHQHYQPEELANEMYIKMRKAVSTRRWSNGKLLPWSKGVKDGEVEDLGLDKILASKEGEEDWKHIFAYFLTPLKGIATQMRRKGSSDMNPATVDSGIHADKDNKAKQIRDDIRDGNLDLYVSYLKQAKSRPFARRSKGELLLNPKGMDKKDRLRLRIISAIEKEWHNNPSSKEVLSLEPDDVSDTLLQYIDNFLKRKEKKVIHASTLAKDDGSSGDEAMINIGNKTKRAGEVADQMGHYIDSDDEFKGGSSPDPADQRNAAQNSAQITQVLSRFFRPYIIKAIKTMPAQEALAMCIKFGIKCAVIAKTKQIRHQPATVPESVQILEPDTIDAEFDRQIKGYLKDRFSSDGNLGGFAWNTWDHSGAQDKKGRPTMILPPDSFCRIFFDKFATISGVTENDRISQIWSRIHETMPNSNRYEFNPDEFPPAWRPGPLDPNKKYLFGYNGSRTQEIILGTANNSGSLSDLCGKVFDMIKI